MIFTIVNISLFVYNQVVEKRYILVFLLNREVAAIKSDKSVIIIFVGLLAFISIYWYTYNNRQNSETIVMISLNKEDENDAQEYKDEKEDVKVLKKIDLNAASVDELSELMYVSDEQAQLIVDYRNEHGDFEKIDDVYQINGLTMMTYTAVLDYTYVT